LASILARGSRRENPALESVFDELKVSVDYYEVALYRVESDCFNLVGYCGPVPQARALSLSIPKEGLDDWVTALETGRPVISLESSHTAAQSASFRIPLEEIVGLPPGTAPGSLLAVPVLGLPSVSLLLVLGHTKDSTYTDVEASRAQQFVQTWQRALEIGARYADIAQRAAESEVLLSVQRSIASRLDLDAGLWLIAEEAQRLAFARTALLLALEDDELVLEAFSGKGAAYLQGGERWPVDRRAIGALVAPLSSLRGDIVECVGEPAADLLGWHDCVAVPLTQGKQVVGLLVALEKRLGIFDAHDERRLMILASIAEVCLRNARFYCQARQVAALEERDRLSRELHDELAQALSYVKMLASLAEVRVQASDGPAAEEHLAEIKSVVDGAYLSVREAIFGLRHPLGAGSAFFTTLDSFLADYRAHYGLDVTLKLPLDPLPELAPDVELQLARIVQESLTNVRRHAAARQVRVQVDRKGRIVVVRIVDDGRGFDVDAALSVEQDHFGLQIMRERAKSFGGDVAFVSEPGHGAQVIVTIPAPED
jgi:signal transduction histidine kinase